MRKILLFALLGSLASAGWGHHSFAADYDEKKPISVSGVIASLDWSNPHVVLELVVPEPGGGVTHWYLEAGGPNTMARFGWNPQTLRVGDRISAEGFSGRLDPHHGLIKHLSKQVDARTN